MTNPSQAMRDALAICGAILELAELEIRGRLSVSNRSLTLVDIEKRATAIREWADTALKETSNDGKSQDHRQDDARARRAGA